MPKIPETPQGLLQVRTLSESALEFKAVPETVNSLSKLSGSLKFAGR